MCDPSTARPSDGLAHLGEAARGGHGLLRHAAALDARWDRLRVAIPFEHVPGWTAQQSLTRTIVTALRPEIERLGGSLEFLVLDRQGVPSFEGVPKGLGVPIVPVPAEAWRKPERRSEMLKTLGITVLLNLYLESVPTPGVGQVGWIFDFQHVYLPEYFSKEELDARIRRLKDMATHSDLILLSSQDAARDFAAFSPEHASKARVHPFPSVLALQPLPQSDVAATLARYHLPQKFALVANQFWAHKNHVAAIRAAGLCRRRGLDVPLVLTGLPVDARDPQNRCFSSVLQAIATEGVSGLVVPLGLVPYADLIALMRASAVMVQPSRFEGWSTSVQDARTLGRPVLASDLAVHREQAPDAIGLFPVDEPAALADLFMRHWPALAPGPDATREATAWEQAAAGVRAYGESLARTCAEACPLPLREGGPS